MKVLNRHPEGLCGIPKFKKTGELCKIHGKPLYFIEGKEMGCTQCLIERDI